VVVLVVQERVALRKTLDSLEETTMAVEMKASEIERGIQNVRDLRSGRENDQSEDVDPSLERGIVIGGGEVEVETRRGTKKVRHLYTVFCFQSR
jgi:hypothetical protein